MKEILPVKLFSLYEKYYNLIPTAKQDKSSLCRFRIYYNLFNTYTTHYAHVLV